MIVWRKGKHSLAIWISRFDYILDSFVGNFQDYIYMMIVGEIGTNQTIILFCQCDNWS